VINRQELARAFVDSLTDQLVVTGIGNACNDIYAAGDRALNFYMRGSMGAGVPIAFGLARARPNDRVICVEGDGSVLMNMGALATIGSYKPDNLTIVVLDNGAYQITGGQPTHTAAGIDLAAVARGCGIESASRVETLVHDLSMKRLLDGQFDESELTMRELEVVERSLVKSLLGIYHGRIAYPSMANVTAPPPTPAAEMAAARSA